MPTLRRPRRRRPRLLRTRPARCLIPASPMTRVFLATAVLASALAFPGSGASGHATARHADWRATPAAHLAAGLAHDLLLCLPQHQGPDGRAGAAGARDQGRGRPCRNLGEGHPETPRPLDAAAGKQQPEQKDIDALVAWLENTLDATRAPRSRLCRPPAVEPHRVCRGREVAPWRGHHGEGRAPARRGSRRLRQYRLRAERFAHIHGSVRRSGAIDREKGDRRSQPRHTSYAIAAHRAAKPCRSGSATAA